VAITPDSKDWTWVLDRRCPECGFDTSTCQRDQISPLILGSAQAWRTILADDPGRLRERARDDRWSPLEYACHVRDVFRLFGQRLELMLTLEDPTYPNWDQDRTAIEDRYQDQDPAAVSAELLTAASSLAEAFDRVEGAAWGRRGSRSDGAQFTVETFGRYMIHDPVHHLHDVTTDLSTRPG